MSKVNETPFLEPSRVEHLPAPTQGDSSSMVEWTTLPVASEAKAGETLNSKLLLHSLRRHWLLALVFGLITGALVTALCIVFLPKNYTARAIIKVDILPDTIDIERKASYDIRTEYEIYKNTQASSLRSDFVLRKALRDKEVQRTKIYQREKHDPVTWLQDYLGVRYQNNAEYLEVSLTDDDDDEVTTVVSAVVKAYMDEVVEQAKAQKRKALAELESIHSTRKDELRTKRASLMDLAEQLKTLDLDAISLRQQTALQENSELRRSRMTLQAEYRKADTELKAAEAMMSRLKEEGLPEYELSVAVMKDPWCTEYQKQLSQLKAVVQQESRVAKTTTGINTKSFSGHFLEQYDSVQSIFEERKAEIRTQLFAAKESELKAMISDLRLKVEIIKVDKDSVEAQYAASEKEIARLGKTSVEIEVMKTELKGLDDVLAKLGTQLEQARLDLRNQSRVVLLQPAQKPDAYDSPELRLALAIIAGCFGAFLPLLAIVFVDLQKKRINSPEDISKTIGLPVMGSVPIIPSRAIRHLNAPSGSGHRWNMCLTESVDGISARLLRNALLEDKRSVLITSAISGEGKTTLAVQLAMSLARAGKRTALVDFDLRRPAIDKAFQLPLDPGVSEALCGETEVQNLGQSVGIDRLTVITAGRCDRHVLQALANGGDQQVLSQLKREYDFVIVDGSPILPVADSRYLAQHVDSVVLSVFRDLSRAPKVMAAYEILKSFGVENIEAVIASPCEAGYGVVQTSTNRATSKA